MADLDATDEALLSHLRKDARASVSELARSAGVSRSTVQDRLQRLRQRGVIAGYTVRLGAAYEGKQISAHVLVRTDPKRGAGIVAALQRMPAVRTVHTVSGAHDLIAIVEASTTAAIDTVLDEIGALDGVEKTTTSIILSTRFTR